MQDSLLDFIGDIYEASYRPHHWASVMEKLCLMTESKSAVLIIEDQKTGNRQIISMHGINRIMMVAYNAGLGKYDNTFSLIRTDKNEATLLPAAEMKSQHPSYYQFILKPSDIGHISVVDLHQDKEVRIGMAVHRSFSSSAYSEKEADIMRLISPHVCRAVLIQRELNSARSEARGMMSLVSKIPMGVLLLDVNGRVRYSNAIADGFIQQHNAIFLTDERLQAHSRETQKQLNEAIGQVIEALNSQKKERLPTITTVSLSHPLHAFPLVLFISADNDSAETFMLPQGEKFATVYISDPGGRLNISCGKLSEIFSFTAAEADVALCLANGLKLADIAAQNGTGLETVRSQLKSIFNKLGVNTQQDVIRIIVQTMMPVTDIEIPGTRSDKSCSRM